MAENLTRFSFLTTSLGAIVNVWLNFLLIPPYSGVGAAIATVLSYAVASHISCLLYPPMFKSGLMLTKALFIPFRFEQNLLYFTKIKQILL
jgi:O-antigen/teichoic acid export membrane protein